MSGSSFSGRSPGQVPPLDQRDAAGCSSSRSGGKFETTDSGNYSGAHSLTETHSADVQPSTTREAHRSAGKTKLTISDGTENQDRPLAPGRPTLASMRQPMSPRQDFSAARISARHSAPIGLNADSMRLPWESCDVPHTSFAHNRGSRNLRRRTVEESSESEAEAIAVSHSKWVTFGMPPVRSTQEAEGIRCITDSREKKDVVESTRKPCVDNAEGVHPGSTRSRTEGSDLQPLSSARHLDFSDLIDATSAQLERAGSIERRWTALEFFDDQPRDESLEEKVAAWDPCQEDSYALSPPGELEIYELDMFDPRRVKRPTLAPCTAPLCCANTTPYIGSPRSPPKSKKLMPVQATDSSMYEDLHWFIESSEKPAESTPLCERATSAGASSLAAEERPASRFPKAGPSRRQAGKALLPTEKDAVNSLAPLLSGSFSRVLDEQREHARTQSMVGPSTSAAVVAKSSNKLPGPTSSTSPRDEVLTCAPGPSSSATIENMNQVGAVKSPQVAEPVASGTEDDMARGRDPRTDEADEREPSARVEKKRHHKREKKKRRRKKKLAKLKKKDQARATRSTQDEAALPASEQQAPSAASPRCNPDSGSIQRSAASAVPTAVPPTGPSVAPAATPAASTSADPEADHSADEVTHLDSGTVSICIKTSMRTRSGQVWPFKSPNDS